ncbi:MAG: antitoxin VbhA family protein [Synergistaceae bacterium]|nr:antitoxin VbhA family protein [Synergistaceae bacterium]
MSIPEITSGQAWNYAIGLIKVDGLEPTPDMLELIEQEKRGDLTTDEIIEMLDKKYRAQYQIID